MLRFHHRARALSAHRARARHRTTRSTTAAGGGGGGGGGGCDGDVNARAFAHCREARGGGDLTAYPASYKDGILMPTAAGGGGGGDVYARALAHCREVHGGGDLAAQLEQAYGYVEDVLKPPTPACRDLAVVACETRLDAWYDVVVGCMARDDLPAAARVLAERVDPALAVYGESLKPVAKGGKKKREKKVPLSEEEKEILKEARRVQRERKGRVEKLRQGWLGRLMKRMERPDPVPSTSTATKVMPSTSSLIEEEEKKKVKPDPLDVYVSREDALACARMAVEYVRRFEDDDGGDGFTAWLAKYSSVPTRFFPVLTKAKGFVLKPNHRHKYLKTALRTFCAADEIKYVPVHRENARKEQIRIATFDKKEKKLTQERDRLVARAESFKEEVDEDAARDIRKRREALHKQHRKDTENAEKYDAAVALLEADAMNRDLEFGMECHRLLTDDLVRFADYEGKPGLANTTLQHLLIGSHVAAGRDEEALDLVEQFLGDAAKAEVDHMVALANARAERELSETANAVADALETGAVAPEKDASDEGEAASPPEITAASDPGRNDVKITLLSQLLPEMTVADADEMLAVEGGLFGDDDNLWDFVQGSETRGQRLRAKDEEVQPDPETKWDISEGGYFGEEINEEYAKRRAADPRDLITGELLPATDLPLRRDSELVYGKQTAKEMMVDREGLLKSNSLAHAQGWTGADYGTSILSIDLFGAHADVVEAVLRSHLRRMRQFAHNRRRRLLEYRHDDEDWEVEGEGASDAEDETWGEVAPHELREEEDGGGDSSMGAGDGNVDKEWQRELSSALLGVEVLSSAALAGVDEQVRSYVEVDPFLELVEDSGDDDAALRVKCLLTGRSLSAELPLVLKHVTSKEVRALAADRAKKDDDERNKSESESDTAGPGATDDSTAAAARQATSFLLSEGAPLSVNVERARVRASRVQERIQTKVVADRISMNDAELFGEKWEWQKWRQLFRESFGGSKNEADVHLRGIRDAFDAFGVTGSAAAGRGRKGARNSGVTVAQVPAILEFLEMKASPEEIAALTEEHLSAYGSKSVTFPQLVEIVWPLLGSENVLSPGGNLQERLLFSNQDQNDCDQNVGLFGASVWDCSDVHELHIFTRQVVPSKGRRTAHKTCERTKAVADRVQHILSHVAQPPIPFTSIGGGVLCIDGRDLQEWISANGTSSSSSSSGGGGK